MNASETAARHREIDRIDSESGFQPQSFQSSSVVDEPKIRVIVVFFCKYSSLLLYQLQTDEYGTTIERQNEHDNAIFGRLTINNSTMTTANQSFDSNKKVNDLISTKRVCLLAHSNVCFNKFICTEKYLFAVID